MDELVNYLIKIGELKTPRIIKAFKKVDRKNFVPDEFKDSAYLDTPLPIGRGQTISQPRVVAFMLELLEPKPGEKILDVGSGSGWQTGLLAELVGREGKVVAIERIEELFKMAKENLSSFFRIKPSRFSSSTSGVEGGVIELVLGDGSKGYPDQSPYDKIIAGAASQKVSPAWKNQLKTGGIMVFPLGQSVWRLEKMSDSEFKKEEYPGFVFVPLIEK